MSANYETLPTLDGVYLEDSYVLSIDETPHSLTFRLDAVLTPEHPLYHEPRPGEQYCYADGTLTFGSASQVEWIRRTGVRHRDANDEEDQGNIDYLEFGPAGYHLGGDWGEVRVLSSRPPVFRVLEDN
ncbi:MAG: hypothetical protein J2P25_17240 [Nocardiopsaceae bacterium]|nr:hypothetical protein [Nocardiopsaceae bacterium]